MTALSKTSVKALFETGDKPTQSDFGDLIDSYQNVSTALSQLASGAATATTAQTVQSDGMGGVTFANGGTGDVLGPSSSTKYAIATFKDTSGKIIENSLVTITSAGNASGFVDINSTGKITTSALAVTTVSAENAFVNGDLSVSGNGTFKDVTLQRLTASAGSFTGPVSAVDIFSNGKISGSAASFVGAVSAVNIFSNGKISGSAAVFTGDVSAVDIYSNGKISGSAASFGGAVSAVNFFSNGKISGSAAVFTGAVSAVDIFSNGKIAGSAASFSGLVSADNGLTVSGATNLKGLLNVSGNAYVSGSFTGGGVAYRTFTAVTTCSIGDFGKVLVCLASTTTTVALRDGTEALPQGYNVRVRMRRSGMVQMIIPAADKIVGGTAYQVTAQNKEALFEVESVSGSEHTWWSAGTN
jgi:hypothetical protein